MAVENEKRFYIPRETWDYLCTTDQATKDVMQVYLSEHARVRSILSDHTPPLYEFTFKKAFPKSQGALEFNVDISADEFVESLELATSIVYKLRMTFTNEFVKCDVDFFMGHNLVILEVELNKDATEVDFTQLPEIFKSLSRAEWKEIPAGMLSSYALSKLTKEQVKVIVEGL